MSTKKNSKTAAFRKWWIGNFKDTTTQPLRYVRDIVKNIPHAIPDLAGAVLSLTEGEFSDVVRDLGTAIDDLDLIKTGIAISKRDARRLISRNQTLIKDLKALRNAEKVKTQNKTEINSSANEGEHDNMNKTNESKNKKTGSKVKGRPGNSPKDVVEGRNHVEWYLKDPTLVKELIGINVANRNNVPNPRFKLTYSNVNGSPSSYGYAGIPSVCSLDIQTTIPTTQTNDWEQGVNYLWQVIRSANAGSANGITPGMLANYILTVRAADVGLSVLGRAIKALNSVNFYDAQSPSIYFAAMGLDYQSFQDNAANAREVYNRLATIRHRLMPLNITLFDRTRWLFGNIFADSDDVKAQVYVPRVNRLDYFLSDNERRRADLVDNVSDIKTGKFYNEFIRELTKIFDDFKDDINFQYIADYILKAYMEKALTSYPDIPQNYTLKPVYDVAILTQIQNATLSISGYAPEYETEFDFVTMRLKDTVSAAIPTQAPIDPRHIELWQDMLRDPFFNSNENVMDAGKILSATRFMVSSVNYENAPTAADNAVVTYDTFGSEVVDSISVYLIADGVDNIYNIVTKKTNRFNLVVSVDADDAQVRDEFNPIWHSWIRYFPVVIPTYNFCPTGQPSYWQTTYPLFDFNNFGIAYRENIQSYHAICTLSMVYQPRVIKSNKTEVLPA